MIYAGLLAGGKGTRMGDIDCPKQFLCLEGDKTPLIIHTLNVMVASPLIDNVVVAVPLAWIDYTHELIAQHYPEEIARHLYVVEGGKERFDSLENICSFIEKTFGLNDDDILFSHEAVRPFINQRIINENIELTKQFDCVDTVVPSVDTIVVSKDGVALETIPNRDFYYLGQTPQTFNINAYKKAFMSLTEVQKNELTDACKVFTFAGQPVGLAQGDYANIKVTTQHDLDLAASILKRKMKNK